MVFRLRWETIELFHPPHRVRSVFIILVRRLLRCYRRCIGLRHRHFSSMASLISTSTIPRSHHHHHHYRLRHCRRQTGQVRQILLYHLQQVLRSEAFTYGTLQRLRCFIPSTFPPPPPPPPIPLHHHHHHHHRHHLLRYLRP